MAYLRQRKSLDFLSPLLAQTIKYQVESVEQKLSGMLFKFAVEQGLLANIIAWGHNVPAETMKELHDNCASWVAETNGIISFEDAYKHQHGE